MKMKLKRLTINSRASVDRHTTSVLGINLSRMSTNLNLDKIIVPQTATIAV
jgi:hypothetical protein